MTRAQRFAVWALPSLLGLWVYWYGLRSWFLADDFAWLGLHLSIFNFHDLLDALFSPKAQGTIRPLSERAYFLVFQYLFDYDALPFRIWAFLTAFADVALLAAVTTRLTRSRMAGFLAATFWIVNSSLATAMSWTSTYNQLLCAFFLLLSFWLFLRYTETGLRRYYVLQWVSFVFGFGALELNVVYPAIALLFALCCARRYIVSTIPLFVGSVVYTLIHNHFAPTIRTGVYGLHWDSEIFQTFWTYLVWSLGPLRVKSIGWGHPDWQNIATTLLLVGLLAFAIGKLRRRNWLPLFMLGWFLIVIGPVLPLRDHISDYYPAIPVAGLAMLGGWACAEGAAGKLPARATAATLAAIYLFVSIPVSRGVARWHYDRSIAARDLFFGVERAHELHPHDIILLKGVSNDLFWSTVSHSPFRLLGINEIYLAPGSSQNIELHPEIEDVQSFELPAATTLTALNNGRMVVYEVGHGPLRNITGVYMRLAPTMLKAELPRQVDAGSDLFRDQLGSTWYQAETGYRWMPQTATVRLGGPKLASEQLHLSGIIPAELVQQRPLLLSVKIDGRDLHTFSLDRTQTNFTVSQALPAEVLNKDEIEVTLSTDRTYTPPSDRRQLAIAFGKIAVY